MLLRVLPSVLVRKIPPLWNLQQLQEKPGDSPKFSTLNQVQVPAPGGLPQLHLPRRSPSAGVLESKLLVLSEG